MVTGFAGLPTRESGDEMVRLLRGSTRLNGERLASLADGQHILSDSIQALAAEIRALIARIDAIIRGRHNGEPPV